MNGGHQIALALRAAYLSMHRAADAHFDKKDVTADQFVLLSALYGGEPITQQELVRRLSSDPNTVGAMLLLLEAKGIVVRQRHPTDGRARTVALNAKGRRVYKKLWLRNRSFRAQLMGAFTRKEAAALINRLGRIAQVMISAETALNHEKVN